MKDNIIKLGYYAYMLRVDVLNEFNEALEWFHEWKQKYNCVYYIVGQEISQEGKPHLQSIVWFENEIMDKPKLRNWWKTRSANTKQSVAFTSAKKIQNLAKYSKKDNNYITNLHEEEIKKIGKWETPAKARAEWSEKLQTYAETVAKEYKKKDEVHQQGTYWVREKVLIKILEYYRANNKRPNRNTLQYLVWKLELSSNSNLDLLQKWNLICL